MKYKSWIPYVIIALVTSASTLIGNHYIQKSNQEMFLENPTRNNVIPVNYAAGSPADFQFAAQTSIPAVVHINTATQGRRVTNPYFNPFDMFGDGPSFYQPPAQGSGSGVIINSDGYIITNNHVVQNTDLLKVTLSDQKEYDAKVIGTDPATDLAVIKIDGTNLPTLNFGNSDAVNVGQWVLAVGYPLNLDATVTAGIVSAKSRNIGINNRNSNNSIESFIQTDAAVNAGNSGGALVNTNGELIGINSAIASPTGSYAGYSYAIPSNIVRKVVNDLIQYGKSQRGYLGIYYTPLSPAINAEKGLATNERGILINEVIEGGAADKAGLQEGDIILQLDNKSVTTDPELKEKIATTDVNKPIEVTIKRNGNIIHKSMSLSTNIGTSQKTNAVINSGKMPKNSPSSNSTAELDQIEFITLNAKECQKYGIESGVQLRFKDDISLFRGMIQDGFIVTSINGKNIQSGSQAKQLLSQNSQLEIGGMYPNQRGNVYIKIQ